MNLPDVQRGMSILAEHIQRLNNAIRQVRLRPGVGYMLRESSGGTSLLINPGSNAGGGSGASIPCPFEVTIASEGTTLKVEIAWGLIWNMLPTGMYPDNEFPLRMEVTKDCYVYSKITFDVNTLVPSEISFSIEDSIVQNTDTVQYNLIARVFVDETTDPKYISGISNVCQQPFPSPCSLISSQ